VNCKKIIEKCGNLGLLLISAGDNVVRLVPPLVISKEEIRTAMNILENLVVNTHKKELL